MENVNEKILETLLSIDDHLDAFLPLLTICSLALCGLYFIKWVTRL